MRISVKSPENIPIRAGRADPFLRIVAFERRAPHYVCFGYVTRGAHDLLNFVSIAGARARMGKQILLS